MKAGWEVKPLGEVCGFVRGPFGGSLKKSIFKPNGYAVYEQQHAIYDQFNEIRYFIDEAKFDEMARFELLENDIIMSCSGTMGKVAIVPKGIKKGIINQALLKLTVQKNLDVFYLRYWMGSPGFQGQLDSLVLGAAIKNVASVKNLKQISIPLPPLDEQKRIVAVLDAAFDGLTRARANVEANLQNARELFESYLENFGHEKKPLGEFVKIRTGKLNANAAVDGGQYPFFTCSRDIYEIDHFAFDCEAILLAGNNASGDFNVKHFKGKFNAYQRTYIIEIEDTHLMNYRYLYFQMIKSLKELKRNSVGANTKFLKLDMIKDLLISVPNINEQTKIVATLDQLKKETITLEKIYQSKHADLDELRQSLLQKAFAGELT